MFPVNHGQGVAGRRNPPKKPAPEAVHSAAGKSGQRLHRPGVARGEPARPPDRAHRQQ